MKQLLKNKDFLQRALGTALVLAVLGGVVAIIHSYFRKSSIAVELDNVQREVEMLRTSVAVSISRQQTEELPPLASASWNEDFARIFHDIGAATRTMVLSIDYLKKDVSGQENVGTASFQLSLQGEQGDLIQAVRSIQESLKGTMIDTISIAPVTIQTPGSAAAKSYILRLTGTVYYLLEGSAGKSETK